MTIFKTSKLKLIALFISIITALTLFLTLTPNKAYAEEIDLSNYDEVEVHDYDLIEENTLYILHYDLSGSNNIYINLGPTGHIMVNGCNIDCSGLIPPTNPDICTDTYMIFDKDYLYSLAGDNLFSNWLLGNSGAEGKLFKLILSESHNVVFNLNGHGQAISSQIIDYNAKATRPTNPSCTGYAFRGWYIDENLTQAFDFDTVITSDITLYAKWTEEPDNPSEPEEPEEPDNPGEPEEPEEPDNPGEPEEPEEPDNPVRDSFIELGTALGGLSLGAIILLVILAYIIFKRK